MEYDRALACTDELQHGLTGEQLAWRPSEQSSGIAWHLGHQAAVAHDLIRNLTAAEARIGPQIDALMDSATPERDRGGLRSIDRIREYRSSQHAATASDRSPPLGARGAVRSR